MPTPEIIDQGTFARLLDSLGGGIIALRNANGYLDTKGMETNLRLTYGGKLNLLSEAAERVARWR